MRAKERRNFPRVLGFFHYQTCKNMKTTLITVLTAIPLAIAAVANGRQLDAADFIAIAFVSGLVAWTTIQYRAKPRTLTLTRCLHLPIATRVSATTRPISRCAA